MKIAVLNVGGHDAEQHFPEGAGFPTAAGHPPVNYHAFAAATRGGLFRSDLRIGPEHAAVVLLLRNNLKACRQALLDLRGAGKSVAIAFKEAGSAQVAGLLAKPTNLRLFLEICQRADGAIATTPELVQFFRGSGARAVEYIPTPYPVEEAAWDFSKAAETRRGIFIGTREFQVPSRNHLAALLAIRSLAEALQQPLTVVNTEGWRGRRLLASLRWTEELAAIVEPRLPYPRYLELMSIHKLVFQLDASGVPGQVAGDALLCRVPCVGGNGATERLAFPDSCGFSRSSEQLVDIAARLLEHSHDAEAIVEKSHLLAAQHLSFARGAAALAAFFASIAR